MLTSPGIVSLDPWLEPFKAGLKSRYSKAQQWIKTIEESEGGLEKFSRVSLLTLPSCLTSISELFACRVTRDSEFT